MAADAPYFSVIVPVYQQWHLVPTLLRCLKEQTTERESFEVILVDNEAQPSTRPELESLATVVHCAKPGSYAARNAGAAIARGKWFSFTDADCRPDQDWLAQLHRLIGNLPTDTLIGGNIVMVSDHEHPNAFEMYDIVKGIPQQRYVGRHYAATANLSASASLFHKIGGFDATRLSGGDADFCRRAAIAGVGIVFAEQARVFHPARSTWHELTTKVRRVKGGQVTAGTWKRRMAWALRSLTPPLRALYRFAKKPNTPLRYRLTAMVLQMGLWLVEVVEMIRLLAGFSPERK